MFSPAMAPRSARRTLTVVLATVALCAAGALVTRMIVNAAPAGDVRVVAERPHTTAASDHWSDEAAMALVGSALLALAGAIRKTT